MDSKSVLTPISGQKMFWVDEKGKTLDPQPTVSELQAVGISPTIEDYERDLTRVQARLQEVDTGFTKDELYALIGLLIMKIENCGASTELTNAIVLAANISGSIGNQWNPPREYDQQCVRLILDELNLPKPTEASARKTLK